MAYIVFMDNSIKVQKCFESDSLEKAVSKIEEDETDRNSYYIYKLHQKDVPLIGTKVQVYQWVKNVQGKQTVVNRNKSLYYAFTHNSTMAWFFADNLFEE
jgi:hypothetical protein